MPQAMPLDRRYFGVDPKISPLVEHRGPAGADQPPSATETLDAIRDGARLAALKDLELLDAAADPTLDRITHLATELLGVPVSLISLIDADRQFFAGQQGLTGEWAEARQTPLSHSICQYAVATREPLVIDDSREDPLVADNLAVRDLAVVAYAGMPLILEDGNAVGALCAIDGKPRHWNEADVKTLSELAAIATGVLDLRAGLARQGLHDRLTGLPNRSLLVACCNEFLEREAGSGMVAVMCAGLDHFNQINQAFGTDNADQVLVAVGERLRSTVRDTDVFGRLRGDIFTVIAPEVRDEAEALGMAGRIRDALSAQPLEVGGEPLSVSVTIGIATGRAGDHGSDLMSEAANAMREAKNHHGRVRVAEAGGSDQAAMQLQLRQALGGALSRGEFGVAYQPIVELESGKVRGFEALARWTRPDLGPVSPVDFIPVAELTADIIPIGEWVIEQAASQLAAWRADGHPELWVTVNVSPLQLEQPNFAEVAAAILDRAGLGGEAVGFEITEGALLETGVIQQRNLTRLKEQKSPIILDDFGTGYSALGYLQRFPVDVIKIDRSFVAGMTDQRHAAALVQAILAMAEGMEMEIVAEGIELPEQLQILRLLGCRFGQGFLFSRPLRGEDVRFD
jgi:diguanylate cyclase (GGDEF)-like protein